MENPHFRIIPRKYVGLYPTQVIFFMKSRTTSASQQAAFVISLRTFFMTPLRTFGGLPDLGLSLGDSAADLLDDAHVRLPCSSVVICGQTAIFCTGMKRVIRV